MRNRDIFFVSFSTFFLSILLLIFNIQKGEVQPWDEGLYAYRAREILTTNHWWDQTSVSLGGLYSSTYPPLVPWAMAINIKIFGENLFSIRLFSVLCSSLTIFFFIYFFSKLFDLYTTFLFGLNLLFSFHWFFYSRQGMTDIPLLFLTFVNILSIAKYLESEGRIEKMLFGMLISLTFLLALMTKIVLSFIPLITLIFVYKYFPKCKSNKIILLLLIGFLLAMPWYSYMAVKYGMDFISSLFPPHLFSVVEGNFKNLGVFYYVNQLIISNPLIVFAFIYSFYRILSNKIYSILFSGNFISDIFFFWFLSSLIIFSLAPTKLPHYTLYIIFPSFYLGLEFISIMFTKLNQNSKFFSFFLLFVAVFWYFSPSFRQSLQSFNFEVAPISIVITLTSLSLLILIFVFEKKRKDFLFFSTKTLLTLTFFLTIAITFYIIISNSRKPVGNIFGGEKTAKILQREKANSFVYVFHKVNDSDTLNPQLAWYTGGKFFGKDTKNRIFFLPIPLNKIGLSEIKELNKYPNEIIVYYTYSPKILRRILVEYIAVDRKILLLTPNYIVFGKKGKTKYEIEQIEL